MSRRTPAEWLLAADAAARELPVRAISLLRARTLRLLSVLGFGTFLLVMLGSQPAMASPGCGDIPVVSGICSTITGSVAFATDPTGYIANQIKGSVGSLLGEFAHLINATTTVDFSNAGFLQTYAIGFGIASIFTIILWLIAVAKRAVAGVGPVEAVAESVGYLVLAVAVTAFMPLATALIVGLVDDATNAALSPMLGNIGSIGTTVTAAWGPISGMTGGNVLMSIIGILMLVAAGGVWLELVIRSALIYLTLAFGTMVLAGLVDKSLWRHTKKYIGVLAGVILSKYVTLTTLALATGLLANDNSSNVDTALGIVLTALALFYLAMLAPMTLGRLIPVIGDDMAAAHSARSQAQSQISGLPAQMNSASEMVAGQGGGSSDADWTESESAEQDGGGASADISGAKTQATGTANTSSESDGGSETQGETDGADLVAKGANGEALPAEGAGAGAAGTAESGAAEAGVAEEAAAAGGPIAAVAAAAEKVKETGEKAVSAAVDRSSGGEIQQAPATPSASSAAGAPSSAGSAASDAVPQQAPPSAAAPQTSSQEQAAPQQSQPSPPAAPSAKPPSQGPTAPPSSGPTPT